MQLGISWIVLKDHQHLCRPFTFCQFHRDSTEKTQDSIERKLPIFVEAQVGMTFKQSLHLAVSLEPKALVGALASLEAPELSTSALVPTSSKGGMASLSSDKHMTYWHYWCILMCMYINYTVWYHCGMPKPWFIAQKWWSLFYKGPFIKLCTCIAPISLWRDATTPG